MAGVLLPGSSKPGSGDITGVTAGDGLSGGGDSGGVTVTLDLNELTAAAVADGDFIPIIDTNDSNGSRKEAVHDLATLFSGTGLTATNSVIAVDAAQTQITSVGTIATGTWEGTTVAVDQGGTGATSLNNLITLTTHTSGNYVATITGGTGITSSAATSGEGTTHSLSVDASQAITALTGGDLTIYEDANNADVSLKMGTSATESLTIQVLNGGSNKTAEEVHFSTATASGTADHGKMVFDIDGTDILTIDDGGLIMGVGAIDITSSGEIILER